MKKDFQATIILTLDQQAEFVSALRAKRIHLKNLLSPHLLPGLTQDTLVSWIQDQFPVVLKEEWRLVNERIKLTNPVRPGIQRRKNFVLIPDSLLPYKNRRVKNDNSTHTLNG